MSVYMTEEEQIENIKALWARHQKWISWVLSIALIVFAGYRFVTWRSDKVTRQASVSYEALMRATAEDDAKQMEAYARHIITTYPKTVYRDAALLAEAKYWVKSGELAKAKEALTSVVARAKMPALQQVAKLRLARIWIAEGTYSEALTALKSLENTPYKPSALELMGDVYMKQGDRDQAEKAYAEAHNWAELHGLRSAFLDLKLSQAQ